MKNSIRSFLSTNPLLKIMSFIIASLLWFFVVSQGRSVIVMDIPIGFKNIPHDLEVIDEQKTVSLSIEGHERVLQKLRQGDVLVSLDMSGVKEGNIFFPLSVDNVKLPSALTITDIAPQTVKLKVEKKIAKKVPVRTVFVGSPAPGYTIKNIKIVPDKIEIKGTESILSKIYSIKTEPIDISGITGTMRYRAYLDISRNNIKVNTTEVNVNITVREIKEGLGE
jgi:YbbR domain-containing protein